MSISPDPPNQSESQPKTRATGEDTVTVNGDTLLFAGGTVSDLLKRLGIKTRAIAVELNQEIVPADQHLTTDVCPGDCLEVVTLVGGG